MDYIWGYFIQLGSNMWRDQWSRTDHRGPAMCQATGRYRDPMYTDRAVWHEVVDFLPSCGINTLVIDIGEGVRYESHPELAIEGAWSKEELRAELARIRALGIEPVPKLNFSSCHDTWLRQYAWMKGTAGYYEVVRELIDEVCELFDHPGLFHLGMDEEDLSTHNKGMTIIRCDDLWCHDLYFYMDCVQKNGARPWIWGDFYWAHADTFARKIPRECLISNWGYARMQEPPNPQSRIGLQMDTYVELAALGYDQVPCASTWCCHQNIAQTVLLFKEKGLIDEHLRGFMTAPWQMTDAYGLYTLMDEAYRTKYAKELFEKLLKEGS